MKAKRARLQGLSPLENPLIVEKILGYSSTKDFRSIRQVCKLWYDLSVKRWRLLQKVHVTMSELLNFVESEGNSYSEAPFEDISIQGYDMSVERSRNFWKLYGRHIRFLSLEYMEFEIIHDFRDVVYKCCPKLEELRLANFKFIRKMRGYDKEDDIRFFGEPTHEELAHLMQPRFGMNLNMKALVLEYDYGKMPVSFIELLSHFPCLETISFDVYGGDENFYKFVNRIRNNDPSKFQFKHIISKRYRVISPNHFALLRDPRLNLETIKVLVDGDEREAASKLRDIFRLHGTTLKKLGLKRLEKALDIYRCITNNLVLVQFGNLQELELCCDVFDSFAFLSVTPNLRKLKCHGMGIHAIENTRLADMRGVMLENCNELELRWEWHEMDMKVDELNKLMDWLPNVEKLGMPLKNETFELVCQRWTGLVKLELLENLVDDHGFTGFDEEDVAEINCSRAKSSWRPITVPRANITALKCLQHFSVHHCNKTRKFESPNINYCAAISGIQQIKSLKKLEIDSILYFLNCTNKP